MNNRGQLAIIAALLVAVILVGTILVTFSKIRDISIQESPQILSAIDEIGLAIDQILGSTIRYYGSVLKVMGNLSYARSSAQSFLYNETKNIPSMYPGWGISLRVGDVKLRVSWFSNYSYSSGTLSISYDLKGLGLSNINYNSSSSLMVQTNNETTASRARLTVTRDLGSPVANLGRQNFGFYSYNYTNSAWNVISPNTLSTTFTNGTYVIDLPQGVDSDFYVVQVEDQRGLMVLSSSSSFLASGLNWNASQNPSAHYVDNNVSNVDSIEGIGSHSNFTAQQSGPDSIYDTLTEGLETQSPAYYPSSYNLLGSTQLVSGTLPNLQADDGVCMTFRSYVSATSTTTKTDAFIAYRDSTTSLNTPKERTWTGESVAWGEQTLMPDAGSPVRFTRVAYSPIASRSTEKIVVTLSDDGWLDAYVWDGTSWSVTNNIGSVGTTANAYKCFDLAYEKTTGRALLVYSRGTTTNEIGYKIWTSSSGWGSENLFDLARTTGIVRFISLASAPGTRAGTADDNEIALIYLDANTDVHGYVWTGSTWSEMGATAVWDATAAIATEECIAVAYEQQSGRAMFVWGDSVSTDNYNRIWNGATLSGPTLGPDITTQGAVTNWVTLKSNPLSTSNELMYLVVDGALDLNTAYWSGSAWTVHAEHDADVDTHAQRCADFAWEPTGSKGLLVWGTTTGVMNWKSYTAPNTWPSSGAPTVAGGLHPWVQLRTNTRNIAGDVKILGAVLTGTVFDLGGIRWDGSTFTVIGTTTFSADTTVITYECFELEFMNFGPPEFTGEVEFTGTSNTESWTQLVWTIDSSFTTAGVTATFQLWNYQTGQYPNSGDGYITDTIGTANVTKTQIITVNPTGFRDASGNWRLKVKGVKTTQAQFDWRGDLVQYRVNYTTSDYRLDLEEQWTNVDYSQTDQLAIYVGGSNSTENMKVDFWNGTTWNSLFTGLMYGWNNISVSSYLTSSTFTIRFTDDNQTGDTVQDTWQIDASLLLTNANTGLYGQLQNTTIPIELLQNGTMLWLGQELATAKARPIPPIPVKSFHVNQTINGIDREVPFQVEDWASSYRIPLGLSSNSSVFSSRSMLVCLVTPQVSRLTVWWNGSDEAIQTPYAYTNQYFTVDTVQRTVTNGILNLRIDFAGGTFKVTSTAGTSSCTSEVFRINSVVASYGSAEPNYAITNGPVRAVIHHEVEWSSGGIPNCPDVLAHLVLTLPANATYYTYASRLMFLSTQQTRTITDLCPIKLSTTINLIQTENGTASGYPIATNTTGLFYNLSQTVWAHHWSQFVSGAKGAGIMFTDVENQRLYVFDSVVGAKTGALKTDSGAKKIELLPVTMQQMSLPNAFDVTWHGAVVTFDGTTPIYAESQGTKTGLWIIAEYPPSLT